LLFDTVQTVWHYELRWRVLASHGADYNSRREQPA
jgi:hypothetical protein